MKREEAIKFWKFRYENAKDYTDPHWEAQERREHREYVEALRMAIEALQFVEHFDLLKEFQSLQEVVQCKNCIHKEHCHETIAHTKDHDGFREHWSEPIEWCSRGERKGGDNE